MISSQSKSFVLSFGKYAWDVVIPHLISPSSGSISPARILKSVVVAKPLLPTKATLSSCPMIKEMLSNTFTPSIVLERLETVKTSLPISRKGRKSI